MKLVLALLLLLAIITVNGQNCPMRQVQVVAGQSLCERQCITGRPSPNVRCLRFNAAMRVRVCPRNCCRMGGQCQILMRI